MNAALIWIVLPGLSGLVALLYRQSNRRTILISAAFTLLLSWIAWQIPIDSALPIGSITLKISSTFTVLGRSFTILDVARPMIALIYVTATAWLIGAYLAQPSSLFAGTVQIIVALLVAALSVEPFLYAVLLIGIAVLISVPLLVSPGQAAGSGVLRFIIFQLFGIPFILFVGWLLTGVEASPGNLSLVLRAGVLLALGFSFLMAVFPFHSWIPMLTEEGHPYVVAFLLLFLHATLTFFALSFFNRFAWLRETDLIFDLLLGIGALVALLGGVWASVQNHLGRQMGYATVFEIGLSLITLGISGQLGAQLIFALFVSRALLLLIWAVSLSGLQKATAGSLHLTDVKQVVTSHPLLASAHLLAIFSFAGLPLSAGFAPKFLLFTKLWTLSPLAGLATLIGMAGILIAGIRTLISMATVSLAETVDGENEFSFASDRDSLLPDLENPFVWLFFLGAGAVALLLGIFPQIIYGDLSAFLSIFSQLGP
jgi:formate hydrogenlyase subunit 3/multisubunit Na+/H+ antiporter MnhD subunit